MKKIHVLGMGLFAVFAFSAVMVSSAFAVSQWLVGGATVTTLTSTTTTGKLILVSETFGTAKIECKGVVDGSVGPAGEDEVTELLSAGGTKIPNSGETGFLTTGTGLDCITLNSSIACGATGSLAEVWPVNLPWLSQLELEGAVFVDDVFGTPEPGYDVICEKTGTSNECTGLALFTLTNVAGGVEGLNVASQLQKCTIGTSFLEEGGTIATLTGTLSVSDV
jgi:hypothetical protein